ncbi:MAG: hypothetical protein H0T76_04555 [Nannocystis sp.]|nr:hypothetical protein [Nannocystis sp.]MBA3545734.1 hypothetical protein [Nannocystis sp.]
MRRLSLAAAVLLAGCHSAEYELYLEQQEKFASNGSDSSGDVDPTTTGDTEPATTGAIGSDSAAAGSTTDMADSSDTAPPSDTATDTGDASDTADSPPVGEPDKPVIVSIELPANVYAAGPVALAVQTESTASVLVMLDGIDAGELIAAGDGLFTGALAIHGAIDNGAHTVEVIATQGKYEDSKPAMFNVSTPEPGTPAWSKAGPTASRTNRVVVTPTGDLIEVGQTVIGGVPRPTIRKRSAATGAELWPEKTITLDTREGAAVDVAMLPDGRMWVAMNVREPMKDSRPRIALLDADGQAVGIEALGTSGQVVRALAADKEGACFAVGVAGVMGDWDFAYWRIDTTGEQTLDNTYDYIPAPDKPPHGFVDIASDVVIDGDVAWIVGMSKGKHDAELKDANPYLRGVLVPMNLHTGKLAGSVIVALTAPGWLQSALFGATLHPEGVLVTGYRCDKTCSTYQIETSLYSVDGVRTWFEHEADNSGLAYGSDVAFDGQGRALVSAGVTQNGKLRGYVFGRKVGPPGTVLLEHWYPGAGPSEALGIIRDGFDRIFPVGYVTVNGETEARITRIHG